MITLSNERVHSMSRIGKAHIMSHDIKYFKGNDTMFEFRRHSVPETCLLNSNVVPLH